MSRRLFLGPLVFLFATLPAIAQSDTPPASKSQDPASTPAPAPVADTNAIAPKKVWTNENLNDAHGSVSVVGDKRNQKYQVNSQKAASGVVAAPERQSLEKLQAQLDEVNKKLALYKDFENGEAVSTNERELDKGVSRIPVDQQIAKLKEKAKKLKQQIDDLVDEARKKGVLPGQLR